MSNEQWQFERNKTLNRELLKIKLAYCQNNMALLLETHFQIEFLVFWLKFFPVVPTSNMVKLVQIMA